VQNNQAYQTERLDQQNTDKQPTENHSTLCQHAYIPAMTDPNGADSEQSTTCANAEEYEKVLHAMPTWQDSNKLLLQQTVCALQLVAAQSRDSLCRQ
jgi:hypothetical protein